MRIILWIHDEANQKALANRIHAIQPLAGIVLHKAKPGKEKLLSRLKKLPGRIIQKLFLKEIGDSWFGMHKHYNQLYPQYPDVDIITVSNINDLATADFTKKHNPDLICVSGTNMVRKKLLNTFSKKKIINLHTGISPYIKGGPNCTNWCLAEEKYELIGNTIMWINAGIDTGNIITTEQTKFKPFSSLLELHIQMMDHAHQLYISVLKKIKANEPVPNVSQIEIGTGTTYYANEWQLPQKLRLLKNFKKFRRLYDFQNQADKPEGLKLIDL